MKEFWDERYSSNEYVYGKLPNSFFKNEITKLPAGMILLPAEGEGRNAIYAAELGWQVTAFDYSNNAKKKAEQLAIERNLKINYFISTLENFKIAKNSFDLIALIYVHMESAVRKQFHSKIINFLKPGGILLIEAFNKDQLKNGSGGPQNIDMLYSHEELKFDFSSLTQINIVELEEKLSEGKLHKGKSSLIRIIGKK
jgi:SAM-dependent methyltransferase